MNVFQFLYSALLCLVGIIGLIITNPFFWMIFVAIFVIKLFYKHSNNSDLKE